LFSLVFSPIFSPITSCTTGKTIVPLHRNQENSSNAPERNNNNRMSIAKDTMRNKPLKKQIKKTNENN